MRTLSLTALTCWRSKPLGLLCRLCFCRWAGCWRRLVRFWFGVGWPGRSVLGVFLVVWPAPACFAGGPVRRCPWGVFRGVSPAWLAGGAGRVLLGLGPALLVGSAAAALGGGFVVCLVVLFRLFFASF